MIKRYFKWVAQILANDEKETLALGNPTCWSYNFSWIECHFGAFLLQSYAKIHSSLRFKVRITTEPLAEPCIPQTVDRDALPRCRTANNMSSFVKMWDGDQTPVVARYMMHQYQYEGYKAARKHHAKIGITSRFLFGWWYFLVPILCWSKSCAEPTTYATLMEYLTLLGLEKINQSATSVNKSASKCIKKNAMPSRFSFEDAGLIPLIEIPGPNIKNDNRFESELFLCQESIPPAWFLNA